MSIVLVGGLPKGPAYPPRVRHTSKKNYDNDDTIIVPHRDGKKKKSTSRYEDDLSMNKSDNELDEESKLPPDHPMWRESIKSDGCDIEKVRMIRTAYAIMTHIRTIIKEVLVSLHPDVYEMITRDKGPTKFMADESKYMEMNEDPKNVILSNSGHVSALRVKPEDAQSEIFKSKISEIPGMAMLCILRAEFFSHLTNVVRSTGVGSAVIRFVGFKVWVRKHRRTQEQNSWEINISSIVFSIDIGGYKTRGVFRRSGTNTPKNHFSATWEGRAAALAY